MNIVLEGTVLTMAPDGTQGEAVGIRDERIEAIGTVAEVLAAMGEGAEMVEAEGVILPAFIDAHHHYCLSAFDARAIDLRLPEGSSIADLLGRVEAAAACHGGGWLRLSGYDVWKLRELRAPTVDELDEVCPDHPLLLVAYSLHEGCLNSRGLAEMSWDRGSPDPPNGRLVRDRRGRLTGEVWESAHFQAESRSREALLESAQDEWIAECEAHGRRLLAAGIVRVGDAAVPPAFEALYKRAASEDMLPVIVHRMPVASASIMEPRLDGEPTGAGSAACPVGPAKLFMDGADSCAVCLSMTQMARSTAEMVRRTARGGGLAVLRASARKGLRPRSDGHFHGGMLFWEPDELAAAIRHAGERGLQVAQHAVGNAAIAAALAGLERAGEALASLPGRPRLEHAMICSPTLARRMADVGAVAVVQPYFVFDFLGKSAELAPLPEPIRVKPLRSLREHGVPLAGSSDYPVASFDVLAAVRAAVTRRVHTGLVCEPDEALAVEDALRAYTAGAALALGVEHEAGTLEPGKRADIVVLSGDPRRVPPEQITDLRIERTYLGGRLSYQRAPVELAAGV